MWPDDHDRYDLAVVAVFRIASTPARPDASVAPARRAGRARQAMLLVVGLLALVVLVVMGAGSPASARTSQDPGTSTTAGFGGDPSTTGVSVTTAAPATTTASATTEAPASSGGPGSKRVADENRKIWLVVGALVAVAIALTLLTVRYWRHTRPMPTPVGAPTGDTPPAPAIRGGRLDHEGSETGPVTGGAADEPVPASEPVPADEPARTDEPAPAAQAAGDEAPEVWAPNGDAIGVDTGPPTEALPVVVAAEEDVARTSRRSVAGADHSGADDGWEPRGTGEHERVVIAPAERRARPTAEQRAAAFDARKR